MTKWMAEKRITKIQLSSNRSDLNPIENLWGVITEIIDFQLKREMFRQNMRETEEKDWSNQT